MTKIIEVIISPTGQTKVETKGFAGSSCRAASSFLESTMGQRTSEQLTAQFHESEVNRQSAQEGQRP